MQECAGEKPGVQVHALWGNRNIKYLVPQGSTKSMRNSTGFLWGNKGLQVCVVAQTTDKKETTRWVYLDSCSSFYMDAHLILQDGKYAPAKHLAKNNTGSANTNKMGWPKGLSHMCGRTGGSRSVILVAKLEAEGWYVYMATQDQTHIFHPK